MIESYLTEELLTKGEEAISNYLATGQTTYVDLRQEAFNDILLDFDSMGLTITQLCEQLPLQTSVTKTAAFNGTITDEDFAQRMRLVIPVSALSGTAPTFTLQGTDDGGTTYFDIELISDSNTADPVVTISTAAVGDDANSYFFTRLYKKYRLQLISIGTSVTYTGYMIEDVYTALHREKTRAIIYRSLMSTEGDIWLLKFQQYEDMYQKRLTEGRFRVDYSDDNKISEAEGSRLITNVVFRP